MLLILTVVLEKEVTVLRFIPPWGPQPQHPDAMAQDGGHSGVVVAQMLNNSPLSPPSRSH
jgi:hypothetical protein